jgi:CHAT domain-containing protein
VLGEAHQDTIEVEFNLVTALVNMDRLNPALAQLRIIDGRLRTFVGRQLDTTGSELVRRQWLATESRLQDAVFTLALARSYSDAQPLAADILLRWKRLAGEQEAVLARLARTSGDPQIRDLARQVQQARSDYSRLVTLPDAKPEQLSARKQARDQSLAELDRLEVALRTRIRTFANQAASEAATWQAVRQALPRNAALLDLRAFKSFNFKSRQFDEDHWLALVLEASADLGSDGKAKAPRLVDLGPVAASASDRENMARLTDEDLCLARYLAKRTERPACAEGYDAANFAAPAQAQARSEAIGAEIDAASARFYAALLGPLDRELAGFDTLYIAPDGALDLVPFARLKLPDGRYWIERQTLRQVRSGRDLIAREPVPAARGLFALGAVDYGSARSVQSPKKAKSRSQPSGAALARTVANTGPNQPNPRLRAACSVFPPVPGTAVEMNYLKTHFDPDGGEVLVLQGRDASKSRLKSHSPPPRVLHLATHGCFIPRADPAERPMTLSLLALAGANRVPTAKAGADQSDNGILNALEVLDLDLTGTELVTLSACDTGKGEVDRSEGVYGLVRAFQIAGAANVLMTLRPLNDDLAAEFVTDFYRNWLDRKPGLPADPASALRRTQLDWIGSERPEKRDPRHWAPYVLVERR